MMKKRLAAFSCALLALTASPPVHGQGAVPAAQQWSGTVTVTRHATGTLRSDDGKSSLGFTGSETITFQLGPDGVATYDATFRSNVNLSGQYSIPTFGTGSGTTYYGIGFNGIGWDVSIDGGDDIQTTVDHTSEDVWWANQFRELIKFAEAVDGKPSAPYNGRVEKGGRGINGAEFRSTGSANAETLSGSRTEKIPASGPEGLDGPPTVPMNVRVTWNLTLGPVQPKVAIRGPDCGCLDAQAPESTPLTFRAGATVRGGEFSAFEVIPEGQAPEIVTNQGGAQPQLVLTGTKETAAVTLKIHYTKNGKRYDAPPRRVEFCTLEEIQLKDDERDLAFEEDGTLVVRAKTKAWHNGEEVSQDVTWDLEKIGGPTKLTSEPADAKAEKIAFTYDGLPEKNDSFGHKQLNATVSRGTCRCQKADAIRAFYAPEENSHPGDDTPNWFFYWSQTDAVASAARSALQYQHSIVDPNLPEAHPIAKYDPETQKLLIGAKVHEHHGCRAAVDPATHALTGRQAEGIDCFAEIVRHEWQHRQDAIDWWGSAAGPNSVSLPVWFALDWDHDQVPNEVEDREPGCRYGSHTALTVSGGKETWFTCAGRPFLDTTDAEIKAYWVGWKWPLGTVDESDWSCGPLGKQWHGSNCGQ